MLIDGVVKRFPTAFVRINTPYYKGTVKALCMENPAQELIVGNVPGAVGVEACDEAEVTQKSEAVSDRYEDECETQPKQVPVEDETNEKMSEIESVINTKEGCDVEQDVIANEENHCAAVQTRAMKVKEGKPQKPLKVTTIHGLDTGPEQLIEQQKTDQTLKKYWELAENPVENGKAQFFIKNGILYRKYIDKHDGEGIIQIVVPESLREKVVSLAHDTLLSGHRGSTKTLNRVLQEFYWPGINNFVLRYVSSCDLCQRNVSKGTVGKAPLGLLPAIGTPFSVVCIDLTGPLSPPSDSNRWILTTIDMCTRFPECIPLRDISSSSVAEDLLGVFSRVGLPDRIHSDRGSQFTSEMMQELYRLLSKKQSTTSSCHAMGNVLCENMNKKASIR